MELADFGNRIPALTFEIFGENNSSVSLTELVPQAADASENSPLANVLGFADEGGPLSSALASIESVFPLDCTTTSSGLRLSTNAETPAAIPVLPQKLSDANDQGTNEVNRSRAKTISDEPLALRYYDEGRDYQPGVQRAIGLRPNGLETLVDLPATMSAQGAKLLANQNASRSRWRHERIIWRIGELDPQIGPGSVVRLPSATGIWRVKAWEWFERGVELELERLAPGESSGSGADAGVSVPPKDTQIGETLLDCFELPPQDTNNPSNELLYAGASSSSEVWSGASLFREQGDALIPIGSTGGDRTIMGELINDLPASASLLFEPNATAELQLSAQDQTLASTDVTGLAAGANRLLIASEIVQFLQAEALGGGVWRLRGLLRGRGGTEEYAQVAHPPQTPMVLIDASLTDLSRLGVQSNPGLRIAAIGRGDAEAAYAGLRNFGLSRRPLTPVHPSTKHHTNGSLELRWTRRARGLWHWEYEGDAPLIEERERYLVGYGPVDTPLTAYSLDNPTHTLSAADQSDLLSTFGPNPLWVRQIGTYHSSNALFLTQLI